MQTNITQNPSTLRHFHLLAAFHPPPPLPPSRGSDESKLTPPPLPPSCGSDELSDEEYLKMLHVGYRFRPTEQELIFEYLMKKINNQVLPRSMIHAVQLYAFTPDQLAEMFKPSGEKEWYFFTPRDRKYKNGRRPNRAAGGGHWKATGAEKHIIHNTKIIGLYQMLTYHKSLHEKNSKTDWLMHEYKVTNSSTTQVNTMRLDDWVLCKVYKKTSSSDNVVNENVTQKKVRRRSRKEVNNNSEVIPESSDAIFSPSLTGSSSVDVAPSPFPMLSLSFESFSNWTNITQNRVGSLSNTINIYEELKYGEGTNKAAKQLHVASSYSIPTTSSYYSSCGVSEFSLPPHYQVPSFASAANGTTTDSSHFQVSEEAPPKWTEDADLYIDIDDIFIDSSESDDFSKDF